MKLAITAVLMLALLQGTAAAEKRPNILFILSDDHSYPFLSVYGDHNVKTPALDQLAAGGMRFHRFFTTAPQCVPSRASLLTGRSPVSARITRFSSPLPRDVVTFPEILRAKAGYFTGVCGRSYHLDGSTRSPEISQLIQQHEMKTFADRVDYLKQGSDSAALQQMREFLDQTPEGKPFFLWLNFSDPHHVWNAPASLRPDPAQLKLPPFWPDLPGMREQLADYCAEVNRLDQSVQSILELLESRGLAENTMVIFCGDNGAALPRGKGSLHDPGCNVPFLVRWPGVVKPGTESRTLLSGEDLAPTLLAAAGLTKPDSMTGINFVPHLKSQPFQARKYVFTERGPHGSASVTVGMRNSGYDLSRAVRSERYKLIYNCTPWIPYAPVDSASGPAWQQISLACTNGALSPALVNAFFQVPRPVYELYDLDEDPAELKNLSGTAGVAQVEKELRLALAEKMLLDFDYLPLPAIPETSGQSGSGQTGRAAQFRSKDRNQDGKLDFAEFSEGRNPAEAKRWFEARDANEDSFLTREEFLPQTPARTVSKP